MFTIGDWMSGTPTHIYGREIYRNPQMDCQAWVLKVSTQKHITEPSTVHESAEGLSCPLHPQTNTAQTHTITISFYVGLHKSKPQSALTHTDRQHKNKLVKKGTHKEALTHTVTVEEFIFDSMQQVRLSRLCKWCTEGGPRRRQQGQILFRVLSFPY